MLEKLGDLKRAADEGMVLHPEYVISPEEMEFFEKVMKQFDSDRNLLDIESAARVVLGNTPDEEKDERVTDLRYQLETFLGEIDWKKVEEEETHRQLDLTLYEDSTPG